MNLEKSAIEYSPAADLPKNRDHPYKKAGRRHMLHGPKANDADKFTSPIAPTSSSSGNTHTLELPQIESIRLKTVKTLASRIDGSEYYDESSTDRILEMLEIGRIDEAIAHADTLYSNFVGTESVDIVALADYIKILAVLRQWRRISHLISRKNYHQIHLVFAYYAICALFHRKLYEEVTDLPVGHLIPHNGNQILPLRSPSQVTGRNVEEERMRYSFANMAELDTIARKLKLNSALMLTVAESYLKLMNRDAAMICISYAIQHDNTPIHVERLMTKYNLVEPSELEKYKSIRNNQLEMHDGNYDPKILMEKAQNAYEQGRFGEAKEFTQIVFDNFGPHKDCMILRIHCMAMLKDSRGLLELGHQLVNDDPHVPLPWYCISLYYYTVGANLRARSYISKCTMMDTTFAEAWVAFGHILHYEVEHEQSMSCYYRASKLVDRSSEPYLYVSLQYSSHSSKLSRKFMAEAVARAPKDPLIRHEEACIAYAGKHFTEADKIFRQVLLMVTGCTIETPLNVILKKKIEDFWRPMINNLGHISRRMGRLEDAILFHEKAVKMEPKFVDAIASLAICYSLVGNISRSTQFFNRALAIDPFNETIRQCMSVTMLAQKEIYEVDDNLNFSFIDIQSHEGQPILKNCALRTPFDDAFMIPEVPQIHAPLSTIPPPKPSTNIQVDVQL
ncbi:unnamed protein product [Caenorhabditis angaria]|uniref:Uncharacterized protein n=1 Tax=Caenorhabditis angaria TaxID=860376 RepID=A0A9P1IAS6_9PELO|nr:unnamed protein product [Caenorhabditis angaria]